jgi:hypothetical protein
MPRGDGERCTSSETPRSPNGGRGAAAVLAGYPPASTLLANVIDILDPSIVVPEAASQPRGPLRPRADEIAARVFATTSHPHVRHRLGDPPA